MSATLLAWMLTYLLHSTLLLGAAWTAGRLLPREALALREALWRTALIGGLVTASLQAGLGVEPGLGTWRLAASGAAAETTVLSPSPTATAVRPVELQGPEPRELVAVEPRTGAPALDTPSREAAATIAAPRPTTGDSGRWLIAAWALGALATLVWLAASGLALAGRLADRRPISGGGLPALLARLEEAARITGVALSASGRIASPMAFGWRRPEICLPDRVATEMPVEQQELVMAHELAHHARRDPVWLIVARLIECLFFFQPLNRMARRRLQEIAEYRCDDWAVERTGRPVTLARCLAEVAEWNLRRSSALPVPTLAVERRRLGRRVSRLLDRAYPYPAPPRPRWLAAGIVSALAIVFLVAPGVSSGHSAPPAPPVSAAPPASTVPAPAAALAPPLAPVAPAPADAPLPSPALAPAKALAVPPAPPAPPAPDADPFFVIAAAAPAAPSAPSASRQASRPTPAPLPQSAARPAPAPPLSVAPLPPSAPAPAPALAPTADSAANGGWILRDDPLPERLAGLDAFGPQGVELSDFDPEAAERVSELSRRMAEMARPDAEVMARIDRLSAELAAVAAPVPELQARIAALSGEMAEKSLAMADSEAWAVYGAYLAQATVDHELTAEERAELERLRAEMRAQLHEHAAVEREEIDRLRAEIRRELEASRPDREEMDRLRQEIRAEMEAARPDRAELERARREIRRELEAVRPDHEELRHRVESRRAEAEALRHEAQRREVEELRAEVERLRAELRQREDDGGQP